MSFFKFFRRNKTRVQPKPMAKPTPINPAPTNSAPSSKPKGSIDVRRYFHNERNFQCYTTWFEHWGGWITAGHCLTDAQDHLPDFTANTPVIKWPDGLDAALVGCSLPSTRPADHGAYMGGVVMFSGTLSTPHVPQGWHRSNRAKVIQPPNHGPWRVLSLIHI